MKSQFNLNEKVVVVTGGAGLIGQEFVKAIIENNGIAIIADINNSVSEKAINAIKLKLDFDSEYIESRLDYICLDITSKESLNNAISYLDKKYNKIDALINNAYPRNKNYGKHFFDVDYSDFVENVGLNLGGYFLASQQFSLYFKKQGIGNIINISSIYGVIAPRFEIYNNTSMTMPVEYSAIKSGLISLTKYMSKYFKSMNIRVNSLSPGGIFNNQPKEFLLNYNEHCLNKGMLDPDDLKGTLIYLLSDMSLYLNGQNLIVDDGYTL